MADIPKITDKVSLPLKIHIRSYMMDHRFEGHAVLPAVEAIRLLAASTSGYLPNIDITSTIDAEFHRFLYIKPGVEQIRAINELEVSDDGTVVSRLVIKTRSKKTSITRKKDHVTLSFAKNPQEPNPPPLDEVFALEGVAMDIAPSSLYGELVRFGPAYHNVKGVLTLSEKGAIAGVHAPNDGPPEEPLGSPFPLDAAFHAACAWGQRFSGFVGFPVGFEKRYIFNKTLPGKTYIGRVFPKTTGPGLVVFDIWIYDEAGVFHEAALGVQMKDISRGRIKPPQWIMDGAGHDRLGSLKKHCKALSVIELKTVKGGAVKTLSNTETDRLGRMGEKRKNSYLGARLCCKTLSRQLSGDDKKTPAHSITTISADMIRPCCPTTDGEDRFSCSVSHDSRFVFAVASHGRVGIDVEAISKRALKSRRRYMSERETILLEEDLPIGEIEASVMVWSIKEAVVKAFGINLADSWERVVVKEIGREKSILYFDGKRYAAFHAKVDKHMFTIIFASRC